MEDFCRQRGADAIGPRDAPAFGCESASSTSVDRDREFALQFFPVKRIRGYDRARYGQMRLRRLVPGLNDGGRVVAFIAQADDGEGTV